MEDRRRKVRDAQRARQQQLQPPVTVIGEGTEGSRLWNWCLFGTSTCIGFLEGYAALKMPGQPLPQIIALRDRLNAVIEHLEQSENTGPAAEPEQNAKQ